MQQLQEREALPFMMPLLSRHGTSPIPDGLLGAPRDTFVAGSPFASHKATRELILNVHRYLGLTSWQLGQLLDLANAGEASNWVVDGKRCTSPSSFTYEKILWLVFCKIEGIDLQLAQKVVWETGDIIYKSGHARTQRLNELR